MSAYHLYTPLRIQELFCRKNIPQKNNLRWVNLNASFHQNITINYLSLPTDNR